MNGIETVPRITLGDAMNDDPKALWQTRRRLVHLTLLFFAGLIVFILHRDHDTALNQQALVTVLGAYTMVLGSFLGFATWHDIRKSPAAGESIVTATVVEHTGPQQDCRDGH